jgi:hypothetical protein
MISMLHQPFQHLMLLYKQHSSQCTTVFLGVLSPPNVQENRRLETGLRGFAVQQTYVISIHHCTFLYSSPIHQSI